MLLAADRLHELPANETWVAKSKSDRVVTVETPIPRPRPPRPRASEPHYIEVPANTILRIPVYGKPSR